MKYFILTGIAVFVCWNTLTMAHATDRQVAGGWSIQSGEALESLSNDSYTEPDTRTSWRISPEAEISLVGRNLLEDQHAESHSNAIGLDESKVERSD